MRVLVDETKFWAELETLVPVVVWERLGNASMDCCGLFSK